MIASIAVVLVAVGVFSVVSYSVALKTHEIGVRMALGALPTQVLTMVLEKGMQLIAAGVATGLFASYFLTRLVASQIWGVSRTDLFTYAGVACVALSVGALACLIPARRASRVDPLVALRHE
jgi:putative ABC transport system permease protein